MKKAMLISIKPEWVAKILNGEKTIEVRKTAPKCGFPIEVYIYCTKGKLNLWLPYDFGIYKTSQPYLSDKPLYEIDDKMNGMIVAKFTLRKVEEIKTGDGPGFLLFHTDSMGVEELRENCRIFPSAVDRYLNGGRGYAWHISDLVVFDKPKELADFGLKRVPQSWCYVEEKE